MRKGRLYAFVLFCGVFGFVSCGSTYHIGTADYDKNKEENFTIPSHADGNLLIKRASRYTASAAPTFIYLDGKYIGKIGSGDYWQGNIEEGEHEIATAMPSTAFGKPTALEAYKDSRVDKLKVNISNSETTILFLQLKMSGKVTITKMAQ